MEENQNLWYVILTFLWVRVNEGFFLFSLFCFCSPFPFFMEISSINFLSNLFLFGGLSSFWFWSWMVGVGASRNGQQITARTSSFRNKIHLGIWAYRRGQSPCASRMRMVNASLLALWCSFTSSVVLQAFTYVGTEPWSHRRSLLCHIRLMIGHEYCRVGGELLLISENFR